MLRDISAEIGEIPTAANLPPTRLQGTPRAVICQLLADPGCLRDVPALATSAKMLLGMPEKSRRSARMLALLAQKDPVFLARLLSLASGEFARHGVYVSTADEAIEALGVPKSLGALLAIAKISPTGFSNGCFNTPAFASQQFALRRCLAHYLTAQRLARYLSLDPALSSTLQLSCLLDGVGLHSGLHAKHVAALEFQQELASKSASPSYSLRDSEVIPDYHLLSLHLAHSWGADCKIIEMLTPGSGSAHALLVAVEQIVEAKLQNRPQQASLLVSLSSHACWAAKLRLDEIELAVLPW